MIWHEIPIVILEFLLFHSRGFGLALRFILFDMLIAFDIIWWKSAYKMVLFVHSVGLSIAAKLEIPAYFVTSVLINCKQFSYKLNAFNPLSTCYIVSSQSVSFALLSLSAISATSLPCGPDLIDRDECNFIIYFYVYCQLIIHNQVGIFSLLFFSLRRLLFVSLMRIRCVSGLALNMIKTATPLQYIAVAFNCNEIFVTILLW